MYWPKGNSTSKDFNAADYRRPASEVRLTLSGLPLIGNLFTTTIHPLGSGTPRCMIHSALLRGVLPYDLSAPAVAPLHRSQGPGTADRCSPSTFPRPCV